MLEVIGALESLCCCRPEQMAPDKKYSTPVHDASKSGQVEKLTVGFTALSD